jgi:hypothetical protein
MTNHITKVTILCDAGFQAHLRLDQISWRRVRVAPGFLNIGMGELGEARMLWGEF